MKAIDKVTQRIHAVCPVLGGYQVSLVPDVKWEDTKEVRVFLDDEFDARFSLKVNEDDI